MSAQPTTDPQIAQQSSSAPLTLAELILCNPTDPHTRELLLIRYRQVCAERALLEKLLKPVQERQK